MIQFLQEKNMPKIIADEQIFNTVTAMLVEQGYEKTTTQAIAVAAGVNETTLFRRYGSKAELVRQALLYLWTATPLNDIRYNGDLQADLLAITRAYMQANQRHGDVIPVILSEINRHPEFKEVLNAVMATIQSIGGILARYQKQGLLVEEPIFTTVSALLGPVIADRMMRTARPNLPMPEIDLQVHVERFLRGRSK